MFFIEDGDGAEEGVRKGDLGEDFVAVAIFVVAGDDMFLQGFEASSGEVSLGFDDVGTCESTTVGCGGGSLGGSGEGEEG